MHIKLAYYFLSLTDFVWFLSQAFNALDVKRTEVLLTCLKCPFVCPRLGAIRQYRGKCCIGTHVDKSSFANGQGSNHLVYLYRCIFLILESWWSPWYICLFILWWQPFLKLRTCEENTKKNLNHVVSLNLIKTYLLFSLKFFGLRKQF